MSSQPAPKGLRVAAYLIDVVPAVLVGLVFGWIPIVGAMIVGFLLACYWTLRDLPTASLGKLALGLAIVGGDGRPSDPMARVLRNAPLAVAPALLMIPIAGYFVAPPVAFLVVIIEGLLVLTDGRRVGDRIAGTTVIKK